MKSKGDILIEHIENHLKEDKYKNCELKGKVICKICNKTADEIYEKYKRSFPSLDVKTIKTCVHGCGEFDNLMKHYKEKHNKHL